MRKPIVPPLAAALAVALIFVLAPGSVRATAGPAVGSQAGAQAPPPAARPGEAPTPGAPPSPPAPSSPAAAAAPSPAVDPVLWPDRQRAFL